MLRQPTRKMIDIIIRIRNHFALGKVGDPPERVQLADILLGKHQCVNFSIQMQFFQEICHLLAGAVIENQ